MRIEKVELEPHRTTTPGVANARRSWRDRHSVLVRAFDDAGHQGIGEASPLPGYSPDQIDDVRRALEAFRRSLAGDPAGAELEPDPAALRAVIDRLPASLPSARFAVETAVLDLLGQRRRQPLHRVLGGAEGAVSVAALLPLDTGDPLAAARRLLDAGFRHLKVKIGHRDRWRRQVGQLEALRRAHGLGWSLRLDANGSLPASSLARRLERLAALEPEFVEEPVAWPLIGHLTEPPVRLAIDESLRAGWPALADWLARGAASTVILKPMVLGGNLACLELARRAEGLGLAGVASHLFGGPVALQATAALALALPRARPIAHGAARHAGLVGWAGLDSGALLVDGPSIDAGRARAGLGVVL